MSIIPKISIEPFTQYLLELGLKTKTANTYVLALQSDNVHKYKSARPVALAKFDHWQKNVFVSIDRSCPIDSTIAMGYFYYLLDTIKLSYDTCIRYLRAIQVLPNDKRYSSVKGSAMAYLNLYLKHRMDDKIKEEPTETLMSNTEEETIKDDIDSRDWLLSYKEKKYAEELDTLMSPTEEEHALTTCERVADTNVDTIGNNLIVLISYYTDSCGYQKSVFPYTASSLRRMSELNVTIDSMEVMECNFHYYLNQQ